MSTPTPEVVAGSGERDQIAPLDWLHTVADQNVPEASESAASPAAWMGRTSTDDAQDPTLSLPRQLDSVRSRLPAGFVIVAKFYDVEYRPRQWRTRH